MAVISIQTQHVSFYDADGWMLRAPVSTGMKGRETPAGVFTILEKRADHRSNLYDDAEMPHMQRLTWNGIAMHGAVACRAVRLRRGPGACRARSRKHCPKV